MARLSREDRIEQIKRITLRLIGNKPLSMIRSAEIASACGISEAALYKCFLSKDALFEAIIVDYVNHKVALPDPRDIQTLEAFHDALEAYFSSLMQDCPIRRAQLRLLLQISMDQHPLARKKYQQAMNGIWAFMENRIRHGQQHWNFRQVPYLKELVRQVHLGILMVHIEQDVFGGSRFDHLDSERLRMVTFEMLFTFLRRDSQVDDRG